MPPELAAVLRSLPDAVVVVDGVGTILWGNAAAERLFGIELRTAAGTSALDFVHPDDAALASLSLASVKDKAVGTPIELRVRAGSGWRLVELVGAMLCRDQPVEALVLCVRDITDRRRWEVASHDDHRFRSLVHHAPSILLLLDAQGCVESVSSAVTRRLGHDQEAVEGRRIETLAVEHDRAVLGAAITRSVTGAACSTDPTVVEVELVRGDGGDPVPFELSIVNLLDDPTVAGLVVAAHDITQLRTARRALEELAVRDALTGLPNRIALEEELGRRIADGPTAAVFLDLDGFKPVNDRHGHAVGDDLLRELADRLRASVRSSDVVARYGGDEFVVVATVESPADVDRLTGRLVAGIERPFAVPGGTVRISASVGLAVALPGDTAQTLLGRADSAMYLAKEVAPRYAPLP